MPDIGQAIKLKDAIAGDLISQIAGGAGSTIRLVTYVDSSASPIQTTYFVDGTSVTFDTTTTGNVLIFVYQGSIL